MKAANGQKRTLAGRRKPRTVAVRSRRYRSFASDPAENTKPRQKQDGGWAQLFDNRAYRVEEAVNL